MFDFFKKSNLQTRPRALAFVDYENWYITLDNAYKMRPDVRSWHDSICNIYDVEDVLFFADFSNPAIRAELSKIREVSNTIIETQNSRSHIAKDFTDFIMLDHIYQKALTTKHIDTFILFTGDGHFSSVVNFLRTKCRKEVIVYGPEDATSTQLKKCANKFVALPTQSDVERHRKKQIISHVAQLCEEKENPRILFSTTANTVAAKYGLDSESVRLLMHKLIAEGALKARKQYFNNGKFAKILSLDTQKCQALGYLKKI